MALRGPAGEHAAHHSNARVGFGAIGLAHAEFRERREFWRGRSAGERLGVGFAGDHCGDWGRIVVGFEIACRGRDDGGSGFGRLRWPRLRLEA